MSEAKGFRDAANQSMVLTALYIAQEQYGHLDEDAMARVADRLDLPSCHFDVVVEDSPWRAETALGGGFNLNLARD